MKKRGKARTHSGSWPFIKTEDPVCDWICVPTPGDMQEALASGEGMDGAPKNEEVAGSVIRAGWYATGDDLEGEAGREVYRELHRAGWNVDRITALANLVMSKFRDEHLSQKEVADAADFSESAQAGS